MTGLLLTVGDEILLGQIVDTNAAWLGERLALAGMELARTETVGDTLEAIAGALERSTEDLVVITGGLGPTDDDLTRDAVAAWAGRALVPDPALYEAIADLYRSRGRTPPESLVRLAEVPAGFEALDNPVGTAPGLWGTVERGGRTVQVVMMPGVPPEMMAIAEASVLPRLADLHAGAVAHRTLVTVGRGETGIADRIADVAVALPEGLGLAYLPSAGSVRVRVTGRGPDAAALRRDVDACAAAMRERLGDLVIGEGEATLEGVVLDGLSAAGRTLATAESCTGGAIASRLTAVPGASRAFVGGVVAYDNGIKLDLLGVAPEVLEAHGAVSEPVVRAMAEGVRHTLGADVGIGVTGIAGPTGGTPEKPVGTVWIAVATADATHSRLLRLTRDRGVNVALASTYALDLVRRRMLLDAPGGPAEATRTEPDAAVLGTGESRH